MKSCISAGRVGVGGSLIFPGTTDPVSEEGEGLVWVRDLEVDGASRVGGGGKGESPRRPEAWVFRLGGGLEPLLGLVIGW